MKSITIFAILLLYTVALPSSYAGLLASSTRVIYNENSKEKGLMLVNTNAYTVMAQLWSDDGSGDAEFEQSAFAVLPSVFKLEANEIKGIRIIFNGMQLAKDRESVFWLNMYEIPAVKKQDLEKDHLNLAMNTQLKIFYRPTQLEALNIEKLQKQLTFSIIQHDLKQSINISNPTAYYVNIINLNIINPQFSSLISNTQGNMIPPFSNKNYDILNNDFINSDKNIIRYELLDDNGLPSLYENKL